MDSNGNNRGNGPIRRYGKTPGADNARFAFLIASAVIIFLAFVIFIMSLTGTGLFRINSGSSGNTPPVTDGETGDDQTTAGTGQGDSSGGETSGTTPGPDGISYKYLDKTSDGVKEGLLLLVDSAHEYKFPTQSDLVNIRANKNSAYWVRNNIIEMDREAINALNALLSAHMAETTFEDAIVWTAYRSFDDQKEIYGDGSDGEDAPGFTELHLGTSVILNAYIAGEDGARYKYALDHPDANSHSEWLLENMHKYGFVMRYPTSKAHITGKNNPWQIRYVGVAHATYMKENNLCLEEYLELLKTNHKFGGTHLTVTCSTSVGIDTKVSYYEIYYVEANANGDTKVPVPESSSYSYTVSGDNVGGFIVTVLTHTVTAEQVGNQ